MAFVAAVTDGGAATVRVPARGARCRALRYDRGASSYHRPHHRVARPEVFFFSAARKPFDRHYRLMTGFRFAPPVGPLHAHTHTHTHTRPFCSWIVLSLSLSLSLYFGCFERAARALSVGFLCAPIGARGGRACQSTGRHREPHGSARTAPLKFRSAALGWTPFSSISFLSFSVFFLGWIARSSFIRKEIPLGAKKNKETTRSLGSCGHCTNTKTIDVVLFEPDNKWRWMCFCFFSLGSTIVRRGFFHVVQSAEAIHWSGRCWWGRLWRRSTRSNQFKRSALISFVLHSLVSAQKKPSK